MDQTLRPVSGTETVCFGSSQYPGRRTKFRIPAIATGVNAFPATGYNRLVKLAGLGSRFFAGSSSQRECFAGAEVLDLDGPMVDLAQGALIGESVPEQAVPPVDWLHF